MNIILLGLNNLFISVCFCCLKFSRILALKKMKIEINIYLSVEEEESEDTEYRKYKQCLGNVNRLIMFIMHETKHTFISIFINVV